NVERNKHNLSQDNKNILKAVMNNFSIKKIILQYLKIYLYNLNFNNIYDLRLCRRLYLINYLYKK
ncbi:GSCOCG00006199001-RA-CDS, partial [Cotesia congregata]